MAYKVPPIADVFWSKVLKMGDDQCWPWTGSRTKAGYGLLNRKRATHISLELSGMQRPLDGKALHACDNPICVNPHHLRWGTDADNSADMVGRKRHHANRRSHCVHGHELSGDNLMLRRGGQRGCRACQNRHSAEYKKRKKQA